MPIRIAVVGPGRLGRALARRWHEAGFECLGFLGRDPARAAAAAAWVGAGEVLTPAGLGAAHVVCLAVSDDAIATVAAELSAGESIRPGNLVFHLAGSRGLEVLAPLAAAGVRIGALHPLVPGPDVEAAYAGLPGRFALCEGGPDAAHLLGVLARGAGLCPVTADRAIDRDLYHAACALAANGATALVAAAAAALEQALGLAPLQSCALAGDLAAAATALSARRGAEAALSGPVLRGDATLVRRHHGALARHSMPVASLYRELMTGALALARRRGLGTDAADRIAAILAEGTDG